MKEHKANTEATVEKTDSATPGNFIRTIIDNDLATKKHSKIATRFPPEPNGYLHIGHAKSICLNFGLSRDYQGTCNLRFDDTNPVKEDTEYVDSIKEDVKWLGFSWDEREYYASDYFDTLYEYAVQLIKDGKAYVDHLSAEEIREYRGTLKEPGRESPYRNRNPEENLELFEKMRQGEFEEGECVLRAKIDMASGNINMRDPTVYRIKKAHHHRTGDKWLIYPMYDFTHCISDALENITHSICTLEFEDHRPLYDWFLEQLPVPCHPQQIEFARLNLTYTVMSKRKLLRLVQDNLVHGWDDPRMPTISGLRRRGYSPESIRNFAERIGVAKRDSTVDIQLLEHCLREDLNKRAPRIMGIVKPLKLVITNYPKGKVEELQAINNPEDPEAGTRTVYFTKELYIDRDDFREEAPRKYFRLKPGQEVRLRYAYYITCTDFVKDEKTGEITEVHCTYDPKTKGGQSPDGRRVKGTIHWLSRQHAKPCQVNLYDHLFTQENPEDVPEGKDFTDLINPQSLVTMKDCYVEPSVADAKPGDTYQFERVGYFCVDNDSNNETLIFNRSVSLKDSWKKIEKKS